MNQNPNAFRFNFRVIQMIAVLLVALAVPLAVVALGIRQFSKPPVVQEPAEVPGLRAALEQAAEKNLPRPGDLQDGRKVLTLSLHAASKSSVARERLVKAAQDFQGAVLAASSGSDGGGERVVVQIPAANARRFEAAALADFVEKEPGAPSGESVWYEFIFPAP